MMILVNKLFGILRWAFFVENSDCDNNERLCLNLVSSDLIGEYFGTGDAKDAGSGREALHDETYKKKPKANTAPASRIIINNNNIYKNYTTRMLLWTLFVQFWLAWTPEAVANCAIHLSFLAFLGIIVILKLHKFQLTTQCVKSGVIFTMTVLCAGCVLTAVTHPFYLRHEFLVKKVILHEYYQYQDWGKSPHVIVVASSLAIMTCVARGLHKRR